MSSVVKAVRVFPSKNFSTDDLVSGQIACNNSGEWFACPPNSWSVYALENVTEHDDGTVTARQPIGAWVLTRGNWCRTPASVLLA